MEGEMENSEFENQIYLFNLHKNQYLSGNVLLRQAEMQKQAKLKEEEEKETSLNKVMSEGIVKPKRELNEEKQEKEKQRDEEQ